VMDTPDHSYSEASYQEMLQTGAPVATPRPGRGMRSRVRVRLPRQAKAVVEPGSA